MSEEFEEMCDVKQVCDVFHVSASTVYNWVAEGKLKAHKPGRKLLIPTASVRNLLATTNLSGGDE